MRHRERGVDRRDEDRGGLLTSVPSAKELHHSELPRALRLQLGEQSDNNWTENALRYG